MFFQNDCGCHWHMGQQWKATLAMAGWEDARSAMSIAELRSELKEEVSPDLLLLLQTTQTAKLKWERESNRNIKNGRHWSPCLGLCAWLPKSYQRKGPLALLRSLTAFSLPILPEKLKTPPLLGCRHHPTICWLSWCARRNARLWVWRPHTLSGRGFLHCHLLAVWLWEST